MVKFDDLRCPACHQPISLSSPGVGTENCAACGHPFPAWLREQLEVVAATPTQKKKHRPQVAAAADRPAGASDPSEHRAPSHTERRDVFISHVEEDGAMARALARELRAQHHTTWTYEDDGVAGISYLTQIYGAIESCHAFVLLASRNAVGAHQVTREVEQAHESQKIIVAVRIGLTHQQFIASNPILRMACGTAVTLDAGESDLAGIAARITATLAFTQSRTEAPVDGGPAAGRTEALPPLEVPSTGTHSGSRADALSAADRTGARARVTEGPARRDRNEAGTTAVERDYVPSASVKFFTWFGVALFVFVNGLLALLAIASVNNVYVREMATILSLLSVSLVVCGLVSAVLFARAWRSPLKARLNGLAVTLWLGIIGVLAGSLALVSANRQLHIGLIPVGANILCVALMWNGLRLLRKSRAQ